MKRIKNVQELRKAIGHGRLNFRVALNGGIYSAKTICLLDDGRFEVENHIDESVQKIKERELYTRSIIGEAMQKGALFSEPAL